MKFPITKYLQLGSGNGKRVLIVGESPAEKGWRISGKAFYTPEGKLLPTGRNLNELLGCFNLSVETCAFTELVKCYVGKDRKLLDTCAPGCWQILLKQIHYVNPKIIIVLGVQTTKLFERLSNTKLEMSRISRIPLNDTYYDILPIYHPSPISPFNHRKNLAIFAELKPDWVSEENC